MILIFRTPGMSIVKGGPNSQTNSYDHILLTFFPSGIPVSATTLFLKSKSPINQHWSASVVYSFEGKHGDVSYRRSMITR